MRKAKERMVCQQKKRGSEVSTGKKRTDLISGGMQPVHHYFLRLGINLCHFAQDHAALMLDLILGHGGVKEHGSQRTADAEARNQFFDSTYRLRLKGRVGQNITQNADGLARVGGETAC